MQADGVRLSLYAAQMQAWIELAFSLHHQPWQVPFANLTVDQMSNARRLFRLFRSAGFLKLASLSRSDMETVKVVCLVAYQLFDNLAVLQKLAIVNKFSFAQSWALGFRCGALVLSLV